MSEEQVEKLNKKDGIKVLVNGDMLHYWQDPSLYAKYNNCTRFISEIIRRYNHVLTDSRWEGTIVKPNESEEHKREFITWLRGELAHPELNSCFKNTKNQKILELKTIFRGL